MLKRLQFNNGKLVESEVGDRPVLLYVNPDDTERRHLVDDLKLDEHTLNSSLDPDELSRLEFEPDHVALIFKRPKNYSAEDAFLFKVVSTGLFLFKDRLIIVVADDATLFEGKQFVRIQSLQDIILRLIYRSIFHFVEHLKVINAISNTLEHQINTAMENKHLLNLFTLEKSLVYYLNGISSNAVLIEKLKNNAAKIGFTPAHIEFLDDILIENNQCHEQAAIYSQVLSSLMDARASIVSNNLNVLMKTLNIITIGIMVPTFVVSAFSMNVRIPLAEHLRAFWMIMVMAVLSVTLVIFFWWRRKW
ncbi:MAG: magnesium transporter CorA family protein [Planctomycetota bacterium]